MLFTHRVTHTPSPGIGTMGATKKGADEMERRLKERQRRIYGGLIALVRRFGKRTDRIWFWCVPCGTDVPVSVCRCARWGTVAEDLHYYRHELS